MTARERSTSAKGPIRARRAWNRTCGATRSTPGMPEIRIDPLSGHRTIVAGERSRRPGGAPTLSASERAPEPIDPERDPFADGHEDRTPPELYAVRPNSDVPNSPGWRVRVVPNLYPALAPEAAGNDGTGGEEAGAVSELLRSLPAAGVHEVIINGPQP